MLFSQELKNAQKYWNTVNGCMGKIHVTSSSRYGLIPRSHANTVLVLTFTSTGHHWKIHTPMWHKYLLSSKIFEKIDMNYF